MLEYPRWRKIWLWGLTLVAVIAALPSLFSVANVDWPEALPSPTVNLGLDLAGGSHLLLEADPEQVAAQRLENMEESVRAELNDAEPAIRFGDMSTRGGELSFMLESTADVDRTREELRQVLDGPGLVREWDLRVEDETRLVLSQTEEGLEDAITQAMTAAADVIRDRVDKLGTREPTILGQGDTRIVVQVPGLQDSDELKELVGKTARLEFKLVDLNALPTEVAAGVAPPGSQIFPYADSSPRAGEFLAVQRLNGIKGDNLSDARAGVDPQDNSSIVSITFDTEGGRKFAELTRQNVNKPFAIILDGKVLSAPNINEPILGGGAQISGGFTPETANQLAIALQSGALPVDLKVVEERTVGPDLGADSIRKGLIAMMIGSVAVVALMVASYGRFGVYATAALGINVLMLLGIMAGLNATLTLPGIAGFVLTVGAAVDANVLINERIREERRRGRRVIAAVENGYKEASRAIYDANITNIIAGALLFQFGSGPIKGFAVVLVLGIATSVFTAVFLTRMWVAGWLRKARPQDLNV
ncbi:protein translocase subunit SecD [Pontixanthobacter sp. CEM42]|uniref:protein translocase subunit SecD n=1 Tax=Pontixanthobacter sp. CEM42 TaxID=2792077 RepID=UPI001ADFE0DA|nr:protein translocase subunit SecD [Pontixanthobacter sp. CEM42]